MIPASVTSAQPLPQTAVDIPQRTYLPLKDPKTGIDTTNAECARCRKGLYERDIVKQLQCGHLFHGHCIDNHLQTDIYCPVCRIQVLFPAAMAASVAYNGRTAGSIYPSAQLPPRAVPVATAFVPTDGTDSRNYAPCRECGQMFYRDPSKLHRTIMWSTQVLLRLNTSNSVSITFSDMTSVKTKKKRIDSKGSVMTSKAFFKKGDWLDVMDGDGVWNVARVLSIPSPDEVEITYDGWSKEYDEIVRVNSNRVAPYHTFTWTVKCWVKYLNWPLWPSLITIRTPGTPAGIRNLGAENRLFVDFLDSPTFAERERCWQKRDQVESFDDKFDRKRLDSTGQEFERALWLILQSDASIKMPRFAVGTLPFQYQHRPAESVAALRKKMGDEHWFQRFTINRSLHKQRHVYEVLGDEFHDKINDKICSSTLKEINLSGLDQKPPSQSKQKKKTSSTAEPSKIKIPPEVEQMDKKNDHELADRKEARQKKKLLRIKRQTEDVPMAKETSSKKIKEKLKLNNQSGKLDKISNDCAGKKKIANRRSISRPQILLLTNIDDPIQSIPSDIISDDKDETVNRNQTKRRSALRSGQSIGCDREANTVVESLMISSKQAVKRQFSDAEGKCHEVVKKKKNVTHQVVAMKQLQNNRVSLSKRNPDKISMSISSHQSINHNAEENYSSNPAKAIASYQGKTKETKSKIRQRSTKLGSKLQMDENKSSNKSKPIVMTNRIHGQDSCEYNLSADVAEKSAVDHLKKSEAQHAGNEESQPHKSCVMQADKADTFGVDERDKPRFSVRTAISVPKKFCVGATRSTSACHINNPALRLAPTPRLHLSTSHAQTCSTLTNPSTAVFSSSKGFSIDSWFKRKLMADAQ
ncbi:FOG: Predicted E3 ubiquitin ligase [Plasmopara halstedii]|uniref:FOG: Predicted E3 ubiquitin ligase n=1 Tax=Plasmopara halstedii TaxID=4781 RepID=A0A0P1AKD4_PLAHL|nr:FOG: Predicted E3 ubiquitin ligase [Plasmopara halstedii]CEG41284.1 FOG: Predicted E3 ubiquitin ligase [Plasmopara halstedii]|eukprot:XP_024577653.1 FOG: Predicted E3 ubiquitin ligase [Plasmopara halstedii]